MKTKLFSNQQGSALLIKVFILAIIIILAAIFIHLTRVMSARRTLNSLMDSLSGGYQKAQMISGSGKTGMPEVAASCGMGSGKVDLTDMKISMDCHDSQHVRIRVESVKGVPMKEIDATWYLPK